MYKFDMYNPFFMYMEIHDKLALNKPKFKAVKLHSITRRLISNKNPTRKYSSKKLFCSEY